MSIETHNVTLDAEHCRKRAGCVPGDYVLLAINDDGCGMAPDILEHVFEPFFTTKDVNEGTGLGLATVYGIVKQNGGFIDVSSEPGIGSTFRIYLPKQAVDPRSTRGPQAGAAARQGAETVLLVEDEPSVLKLGKSMLETLGYRVIASRSPAEAIVLAREHAEPIDLLLTDVVMPDMNGRELAERLQGVCPTMKHLFMSGYTADVIANHGVVEEGLDFIQKPFTMAALGEKLRSVLDRNR